MTDEINETEFDEVFQDTDAVKIGRPTEERADDTVTDLSEENEAPAPVEDPYAGLNAIDRVLCKNEDNWKQASNALTADAAGAPSYKNIDFNVMISVVTDNWGIDNLVGIQPMDGPVGLAYNLRYQDENGNPTRFSDEESPAQKRMSLDVVSHAVEAGSRKLQAAFTIEAMQDLTTIHDLDFEKEMYNCLGQEIAQEYLSEVLHDLMHTSSQVHVELVTPQEFSIYLSKAANNIARKTRRGAGNWIVVGANVLAELLHLRMDHMVLGKDRTLDSSALQYIGTLNSTMRVFYSNTMPANKALVGYKGGSGEVDCGYMTCPYVLLMTTGVVINPVTFQPLVTFMTRYGKLNFRPVTKTESVNQETGELEEVCAYGLNPYYVTLTHDSLDETITEASELSIAELTQHLNGMTDVNDVVVEETNPGLAGVKQALMHKLVEQAGANPNWDEEFLAGLAGDFESYVANLDLTDLEKEIILATYNEFMKDHKND